MMDKPLPKGKRWDDSLPADSLEDAIAQCKRKMESYWFHIRGHYNFRFEVWPGGRGVSYPLEILQKRREREASMAERI